MIDDEALEQLRTTHKNYQDYNSALIKGIENY